MRAGIVARSRITEVILIVGMGLAARDLGAAEHRLLPYVDAAYAHDDNMRLRTEGKDRVEQYLLMPGLQWIRRSETEEYSLDARYIVRRHPGDEELDSDDQALRFGARSEGERGAFSFDTQVLRDTSLTSELLDSGLTQLKRRRLSITGGPSWSYALSERLTGQLSAQHQDVDYDADPSEFLDFRYSTVQGGLQWQLAERQQAHLQLVGSRFEVPDIGNTTDSISLLAGWQWTFSETGTAELLVGARATEEEIDAPAGDSTTERTNGGLFQLRMQRALEDGSFTASLARELTPSSLGQLNQTDRVSLRWRYDLAPLWYFNLGLTGLRSQADNSRFSDRDRKYYAVEPALRWRATRTMSVGLGYRYRWQKYDEQPDAANSNYVALFLSYRPEVGLETGFFGH